LTAGETSGHDWSVATEQLYLAIGVRSLINIGLISLPYVALSNKIDSLAKVMEAKFEAAHQIRYVLNECRRTVQASRRTI